MQSTCEKFDHAPFFTNLAHLSATIVILVKVVVKFMSSKEFIETCMLSWLGGGGA